MTKKLNPWQVEKELDRVGAEGVWLGYDLADFSCLIRSAESPLVREIAEQVWVPIRAKYRNRDIPDNVQKDAHVLIIANALVADWQDQVDEKGEPLPYSPDAVARYATDNERFQRWVISASADRKLFLAEIEAQAAKNSSTASSGPSSGAAVETSSEKLH